MTLTDVAKLLLEVKETDANSVEFDRVLLRILNYPSLMANLQNIGQKDGTGELTFANLPDVIINDIPRIIGPTKVDTFKFDIKGRSMVGFRFDLAPLAELTGTEKR